MNPKLEAIKQATAAAGKAMANYEAAKQEMDRTLTKLGQVLLDAKVADDQATTEPAAVATP